MDKLAVRPGGKALATKDPLADILAGQLSEQTRRAYRQDVSHLLLFLSDGEQGKWAGLSRDEKAGQLDRAFEDTEARKLLLAVTRAELIGFRVYLKEQCCLSTAAVNRRLAGVSSILRELSLQGYRADNPANGIKTLRRNGEYSSTMGLSAKQAKALLSAPTGDNLPALRDRAILAVMVRNGLRAAEVVGLNLSDLGEDQGFRVAIIHGKGEKIRKAKLAGPTWEALEKWLDTSGRWQAGPVFCPVHKHGRGEQGEWIPEERAMTTVALAKIIHKHAVTALGEETAAKISPHSLRHTFATIGLEGGASLRRMQYAMGHADPRTTERYDRARENLADNAADYVSKVLNGAGL
jgi:site-specific recombinase XerD